MIGDSLTYKYLLESAPKEKINYSYSKYNGEDFIDAWKNSRLRFISLIKPVEDIGINDVNQTKTEILFTQWKNDLVKRSVFDFKPLNLLVKRFEVTKKIYSEYDRYFRPLNRKSFMLLGLYVQFGVVLGSAYGITKKLPYLNSLIKINDIGCSLFKQLTDSDKNILGNNIRLELDFVDSLRANLH